MVTVVEVAAVPAPKPGLATVWPAEMVYVLVTGKMLGLLEVRVMVAPPVGAGALRVRFKYAVPPLLIGLGVIVKLLIVGTTAVVVKL